MRSAECGYVDAGTMRGSDLLQTLGPTIAVRIGLDSNYVVGSDVLLELAGA